MVFVVSMCVRCVVNWWWLSCTCVVAHEHHDTDGVDGMFISVCCVVATRYKCSYVAS